MRKKRNSLRRLFTAVLLVACFPAFATAAQWAMHRYDPQHTGSVTYVGPTNPVEKWVFQDAESQGGVAIADDGTIYFVNWRYGDKLYALNPDGSLKQAYDLSANGYGYGCCTRPVIGPDGTIYVSARGIVAFTDDPVQGLIEKWYQPNYGSHCCGSLSLGPDGSLYSVEGSVVVLDTTNNGALKWNFDCRGLYGEFATYAPAVSYDGSKVYITTQHYIYARGSLDGADLWSYPIENPGTGSAVVAADGSVYVPDGRNVLVLAERPAPKKGLTKRYISVGTSTETVFEIALANDGFLACVTFETISYTYSFLSDYASSAVGARLYLFDPNNNMVWSTPKMIEAEAIPYDTQTPVPLIDANHNVYLATADNSSTAHIYGFDVNGNTLIDDFYWDGVGGGPVTVAMDGSGVLYASFFDGYTYAYEQAP